MHVFLVTDCRPINFYYQMPQSTALSSPSQPELLLSLQQTTERQANLRKINDELTKIIQNSHQENSHLELISKLNSLQADHNKEIQHLKLKCQSLQADHHFQLQQYKNQYEDTLHRAELAEKQRQKLKEYIVEEGRQKEELIEEVKKHEKTIKKQELLLNQYRESLNESIELQKQVMKAEYGEKQLQMKRNFERGLKEMEDKYEKQLKDIKVQIVKKQFQKEVEKIKKICHTTKRKEEKENHNYKGKEELKQVSNFQRC